MLLAALAVVLAAVWAVAAVALWQSQVPGGLELPQVDLTEYVDAETLERADRYESFLRWEFDVSQLVLLGVLALYAPYGLRLARE